MVHKYVRAGHDNIAGLNYDLAKLYPDVLLVATGCSSPLLI